MESFPSSPSSSSPVFTNVPIDLLLETTDLDARMTSSPDDITTVDPNAPAPPVDPPTLEPDISVLRHSTRVINAECCTFKSLNSHMLIP
jgi:hypothetical protein